MKTKTITICGGGSIGHVVAGVLGNREDTVVQIFSPRASLWQKQLLITDCNGRSIFGNVEKISHDAAEIIPDSDVVFLCVPGFMIESVLRQIEPWLSPDTYVGACVASSGFFFTADKILQDRFPLFGFQRVPYIARVSEYGRSANLLGYKKELYLGQRFCRNEEEIAHFWQQRLETPVSVLPSFYDAALSNSNPILHPSRLYGMWHDWKKGVVYSDHTRFYEDWDDFSSEILIACDQDFFNVIRHYPCTPGALPRLLDYYESSTPHDLSRKLRSINAFKGILAPMEIVENGYVPKISDRYFTEDIPFGLQIIKDLASKVSQETPAIDNVLSWYSSLLAEK